MFNLFSQKHFFRKNIAIVLILIMVISTGGGVLFYPKMVQAQYPVSDVTQIGQNAEKTASDKAWQAFKKAYDAIASKYNAAANWISANLGLSKEAREMIAQATRIAATLAMYQVLNMLTNQIVKWIQGGGTPQFISDWKGFLTDAADKAGGLFIDKYLGAGYLCESFDLSVKIALLPVPTFEERVACSISDIVVNVNDFANDFSQGSWKGWIKLTKPENNFYGGYFNAREEKLQRASEAKEAALKEAETGGGFLSVKVCVKGHVGDGEHSSKCNDKDSCKALEKAGIDAAMDEFVCDEEKVVTPGSAISDMTNEVIKKDFKLLQDQIANMTSSLGSYAPYVITIANALINRVIQEGFAYVTATGPTAKNPNIPMPPGQTIPEVDKTPSQITEDQGYAISLLEQQRLLKENLETQLLPQQQSNLGVMQNIETIQINTITTLSDILSNGCLLPFPIIDPPQIISQIINLEEDIFETNQRVADIATAIISTNGYNQAAEEYLELYQTTLQPPTTNEQAALDQKALFMDAAKNIAIDDGLLAALSITNTNNFFDVNTDTQNASINVITVTTNLLMARGVSTAYPAPGTLYAQKNSAQTTLDQAISSLNSCLYINSSISF